MQIKKLQGSIVCVEDMVHRPKPKHEVISSGVAILRVGEWVEVEHDFSPGHNSGGGVDVIMDVTDDFCEVKYVVSGCYE